MHSTSLRAVCVIGVLECSTHFLTTELMPLKKRSIKFLRKAAKTGTGLKKMGRKRARKDDDELAEVEVDKVLSMKDLKESDLKVSSVKR
jgi:hypothetical protein